MKLLSFERSLKELKLRDDVDPFEVFSDLDDGAPIDEDAEFVEDESAA